MTKERDLFAGLLDPAFLAGLDVAALHELSDMRADCRRAGMRLAHLGRVLTAELALVESEIEWRATASEIEQAQLGPELPVNARRTAELGDAELAGHAEELRTRAGVVSARRRALHQVLVEVERQLAKREALVDAGLAALLERGGPSA